MKIACMKCKAKMDHKAAECPSCGYNMKKQRKIGGIILGVVGGIFGCLVLLIIIGATVGKRERAAEETKTAAEKESATPVAKQAAQPKIKLPDNFIKVDNVTKLQVNGLYYLSDPAILAPAFNPKDVSRAMRKMKKIPKGYFFLIKDSKIKAVNPWYKVEIIKPGKEARIIERGWINSTNLFQQDDLRQVVMEK